MLELSGIDLEEIANTLDDQTDYEHHWLINPDTGGIAFWTADTGIDGQTPADLDELDLIVSDGEGQEERAPTRPITRYARRTGRHCGFRYCARTDVLCVRRCVRALSARLVAARV